MSLAPLVARQQYLYRLLGTQHTKSEGQWPAFEPKLLMMPRHKSWWTVPFSRRNWPNLAVLRGAASQPLCHLRAAHPFRPRGIVAIFQTPTKDISIISNLRCHASRWAQVRPGVQRHTRWTLGVIRTFCSARTQLEALPPPPMTSKYTLGRLFRSHGTATARLGRRRRRPSTARRTT